MSTTRRIRKLEQNVVDRIAAGEVIQRPRNVVKELIENSLDAKATNIQISFKYAGSDIQLIQVKDNGHGIEQCDLEAVCDRFSTSKLETFDDLSHMQTYGFRGEALASMSHVSHVTIVSKIATGVVGYEMKYEEGKPTGPPKALAANKGTIVSISDLFYNTPLRKNALRNLAEEYKLIVELVTLYALDNLSVSFILKKNNSAPDVKTACDGNIMSTIRDLFGERTSKNLVPINYAEESKLKTKVSGIVGDLKSTLKSYVFILFINKRLVDCQPLKKSIEAIYKNHLAKGSCSFIFFSIAMSPEHLDVNVHPTKTEVRFLFEDEIIQELVRHVELKITSPSSQDMEIKPSTPKRPAPDSLSPMNASKRPSSVIRNCPQSQRVDDMLYRQRVRQEIGQNSRRIDVQLKSVLTLRDQVRQECDTKCKRLLTESTFVGFAKNKFTLFFQNETYLLAMDLTLLSDELFYQVYLEDFQNFGLIDLAPSLPLSDLASIFISNSEVSTNCDANAIAEILIEKKDMIDDYFSIRIDDEGNLRSIPILLDGYLPDMRKLPEFIYDLSLVDWSEEQSCFESFGRALAKFYMPLEPEKECERDSYMKILECIVFPVLKKKFLPPKHVSDGISLVSSVSDLYKVFHRC